MQEQRRSATLMADMIAADSTLLEKMKQDPIAVLKDTAAKAEDMARPGYWGDITLYRIAIIVLGLLSLMAAVGSFILGMGGKDIPQALVALGSTAVGGLVGLFAPSPITK